MLLTKAEARFKKWWVFKTQSSHWGAGPRSLQAGDEFWIPQGTGMQFVLRHQPNDKFGLNGEAFVYRALHLELRRRNIKID
jgi:hypothetical protein